VIKKVILLIVFIILLFFIASAEEGVVEAAKKGDLKLVKEILLKDPSKLKATDKSQYTAGIKRVR
jgi:hypothetical protein